MTDPTNHHSPSFFHGKPHRLSLSDGIAISCLIVTILGVFVAVATPEIRGWLHLPSQSSARSMANKTEDSYQKDFAVPKLERYSE